MNTRLKKLLLLTFLLVNQMASAQINVQPSDLPNELPDWALGGFVRIEDVNPVLSPKADTEFKCPMRGKIVRWEESDVFNPASVTYKGKIVVLYRAEDNTGLGIGKRTSRIGLAYSKDGVKMHRMNKPVLYPANDEMKEYEWEGGCEDPRVVKVKDGTYLMTYTSWNRKTFRLCIASSMDLRHWTKHGPVFAKCYGGRFKDMSCKSASMVTKVVNGEQVLTKLNGKYFMFWGERHVHAATSDNMIDWTPVLDSKGNLTVIAQPRKGYFDSGLTECGPPALWTNKGIVLLYNGKNRSGVNGDQRLASGTYSAGQLLVDSLNPMKVIQRLDVPFFRPVMGFERKGQYSSGTVFLEGLTYFRNKWYLYYGCADSRVGVAVYNPNNKKGEAHKIPK